MEKQLRVVLVSMPDEQKAASLARALIEKRLAACVSVLGGVRSFYRWKGELCQDPEVLLLIKTRKDLMEPLMSVVRSLHPYELPEILALDVADGLADYMNWVCQETA
ncbi:MAG: divalent-cation tolerance protein CutA [bacterium]